METPLRCPSLGHSNGGRKSMKTSGIHFCYKNRSARPLKQADIYINTFHDTSTVKIAKKHWINNIFQNGTCHILSAILMSSGVRTSKFKMFYYTNEGCYRAENLQKEIFLGCSITKES